MGPESTAAVVAALLLGSFPGGLTPAARSMIAGAVAKTEAQSQLDLGLRALNSFDDVRARQILTRLLAEKPPSAIAAKAHVYLGIIEFNRLEVDRARDEFQRAVEIDPAVEPPLTMSPKARLAFSEARRTVTAELAKPVLAEPPLPSAPEASVTAPQEEGHIPAGAWWLGGGGLAVGVVGTVLYALAESTLSGDHTTALGSGVEVHTLSYSTVNAATTEGNAGEVLWAVGGALLVAGGVVALTGGSK